MKKVIFTCITENYDSLKQPNIITDGWEYLCFTNNKELEGSKGAWRVFYTPSIKSTKDQRRIKITYPFIHDWDLSIWVDGSMTINCNLDDFINNYHKTNLTILKHPHRKCIYEEADACVRLKKDDRLIINEQVYIYRKSGLPRDVGMVGSGLIIRNNKSDVKEFCDKWWSEVEKFSKRDQLSFNYVMYFSPIKYNMIPYSILKSEFILNRHNNKV